ncbi:MAG: hypothetical protein AAB373_00915 [Patescibacteria group bacterium]
MFGFGKNRGSEDESRIIQPTGAQLSFAKASRENPVMSRRAFHALVGLTGLGAIGVVENFDMRPAFAAENTPPKDVPMFVSLYMPGGADSFPSTVFYRGPQTDNTNGPLRAPPSNIPNAPQGLYRVTTPAGEDVHWLQQNAKSALVIAYATDNNSHDIGEELRVGSHDKMIAAIPDLYAHLHRPGNGLAHFSTEVTSFSGGLPSGATPFDNLDELARRANPNRLPNGETLYPQAVKDLMRARLIRQFTDIINPDPNHGESHLPRHKAMATARLAAVDVGDNIATALAELNPQQNDDPLVEAYDLAEVLREEGFIVSLTLRTMGGFDTHGQTDLREQMEGQNKVYGAADRIRAKARAKQRNVTVLIQTDFDRTADNSDHHTDNALTVLDDRIQGPILLGDKDPYRSLIIKEGEEPLNFADAAQGVRDLVGIPDDSEKFNGINIHLTGQSEEHAVRNRLIAMNRPFTS